jgi:hypothetical protein
MSGSNSEVSKYSSAQAKPSVVEQSQKDESYITAGSSSQCFSIFPLEKHQMDPNGTIRSCGCILLPGLLEGFAPTAL